MMETDEPDHTQLSGLNVVTLTPGCGYGDAACQYIAGLHRLGVPVTWTPTISGRANNRSREKLRLLLQADIAEDLMNLLWRPLDCSAMLIDIPPFHWQQHWREKEPNLRPFTYITWEVEQIPQDWIPVLNSYERIFVPSTFNQRTLTAAGITAQVDVVPHVARKTSSSSVTTTYGDVNDEDFVFYTIGSWTSRKAMQDTVRAYLDAFTKDDKVALIIKTDHIDQIAHWALPEAQRRNAPPDSVMVWWTLARILASYPNPAKIQLISKRIPAVDVDNLHRRGDCFVSLTRSEGWGLGPFDAALHGNPAIITGWGGHLDYLGEDFPFLLRYEMEPVSKTPADGFFDHVENAFWARADPRHAAETMRAAYENRDQTIALGRNLQHRLSETYAADKVCRRLASLMGFSEAS